MGDWLALDGDHVVAVLDRSSLLRRRAAGGDGTQLLAANVDLVLLVCGLDRPVRSGRIQRGEALAWDAGATPVLVLTKADARRRTSTGVLAAVDEDHPGLEVHVTSVTTGAGDRRPSASASPGATSVLLGESGAGKSSLVNALLGSEVAATGEVREGDAKGRHTTTNRQLHLLAGGGVLIDTPGIREVGLAGDEDSRRRHLRRHRRAGRARAASTTAPTRASPAARWPPRSRPATLPPTGSAAFLVLRREAVGRRPPGRRGGQAGPRARRARKEPAVATTSSTRAENGGDPGRQTRRSGSAARGHQSVGIHLAISPRR